MLKTSASCFLAACLLLGGLSGAPAQEWKPAAGRLMSRFAKDVSPRAPLPEYPRPQMTRKDWLSLNGLWSYGLGEAASDSMPSDMSGRILVPYPYESALSGVGKPSVPTKRLWYRRTFAVPPAWKGRRVLLHFGAVNYEATVRVNGRTVGAHRGGFDAFSFDVTPHLKPGRNELVVSAANPLRIDVPDAQVVGKQRLKPGGIFYTAATGIWQTVWLEPVPEARHIHRLKITPDINASTVRVTVAVTGGGGGGGNAPVRVTLTDGGKAVASATGAANRELTLRVRNMKLWSPEAPFLYGLEAALGSGTGADRVGSYAALRKASLGRDARGRRRLFLNNKFVFQVGVLDQGYWPDGIYTAPTDRALRYDIEAAKRLGWNLLRKHAKVEPARWYYHADKLGMLVWQDMPQMYGGENGALSGSAKAQFEAEWREIIAENYNAPSIVVWTTFNEGMGQHDTERIVSLTRRLDPTRLVNNASGWVDKRVGDMHDSHVYPGPGSNEPEAARAAVNGEFGGITYDAGHRWVNDAAVMGYGATLRSGWLATKRYQNLMRSAFALRDARGTSAVVYTQLTDVEQEINGVLTYDRAVVKLDPEIVRAANRGRFLPLPPNPNPNTDLVPTSEDEPLTWRYTTERPGPDWFLPDFDDARWRTGPAPFGKDAGNVRTPWTTSDLWIRRSFTLSGEIPARLNLLILHDEDAEVYVNGVPAASVTGHTGEYKTVPMSEAARAALKPGRNTLAVHVRQTVGGQSIDVGIARAK